MGKGCGVSQPGVFIRITEQLKIFFICQLQLAFNIILDPGVQPSG